VFGPVHQNVASGAEAKSAKYVCYDLLTLSQVEWLLRDSFANGKPSWTIGDVKPIAVLQYSLCITFA